MQRGFASLRLSAVSFQLSALSSGRGAT